MSVDSSSLCQLIILLVPCKTGAVGGDPHFQTVDKLEYTYNGKGEFWLQRPTREPMSEYFCLQARTTEAIDSNGVIQPGATVFVAFAAKDNGTARVHIGMSADRTSKVLNALNEASTQLIVLISL